MTLSTITDYFRLILIISDYFCLFLTISDYKRHFLTITDYFWLFQTISDYFCTFCDFLWDIFGFLFWKHKIYSRSRSFEHFLLLFHNISTVSFGLHLQLLFKCFPCFESAKTSQEGGTFVWGDHSQVTLCKLSNFGLA